MGKMKSIDCYSGACFLSTLIYLTQGSTEHRVRAGTISVEERRPFTTPQLQTQQSEWPQPSRWGPCTIVMACDICPAMLGALREPAVSSLWRNVSSVDYSCTHSVQFEAVFLSSVDAPPCSAPIGPRYVNLFSEPNTKMWSISQSFRKRAPLPTGASFRRAAYFR